MTAPKPALPTPALSGSEVVDGELRLILQNAMEAMQPARLAILQFLQSLALDPMVINRLEVVFEEVIANIVRHGLTPGSGQSIAVRVAVRPGAIVLQFEDDGVPFNPLEAPPPPPFTSLETAPLGGLGIALVRKLAADVRYETPRPAPAARFKPTNRLSISIATAA